jgi:hypothetical protein
MIAISGTNKRVLSIADVTEEEMTETHLKRKMEEYLQEMESSGVNVYEGDYL